MNRELAAQMMLFLLRINNADKNQNVFEFNLRALSHSELTHLATIETTSSSATTCPNPTR